MIGEWIRRIGFWGLDFLQGSAVRSHYLDIKEKMQTHWSPEEKINEVIQYAKENVPFYAKIEQDSILGMPVMTKSIYTQNGNDVRSNLYFDEKKLHWVRTSGSTGTPFSAPQDSNKRNRTIAELLYFHDTCGWKLGDRYLFIRAWVAYNASLKKRIMNNFVPFEATNFNTENKGKLLEIIKKDRKLQIVFGYSSVITDLAEYILESGCTVPNPNVKLVVVDSDTLLEGAKEKIEKAFGCPVMNRYDNEEHGVLAVMRPGTDYWEVNTASYYIELLKIDEDIPCDPGEVGRVVVTDLTNRAFPFIRYDLGDLAYSNSYNGRFVTRIDGLEGKTKDIIYDTAGNRIGNVSFAAYFELFMEIQKYQLIQTSTVDYTIKVELKPGMSLDKEALISKMQECLGHDSVISVEVVEKIETTGAGKYRPVISAIHLGDRNA